jgi:hypothetical protein
MKVITSNLFIDYDGKRTCDLLDSSLLTKADPDVIMIQEMYYKQKSKIDEKLSNYTNIFPAHTHMACCIYVKNNLVISDHKYIPFKQTFMERGLYAVNVDDCWYVTAHLESMNKPQFEKIRKSQLSEIEMFASDKSKVVVGMDSNVEGEIKIRDFIDVWCDTPVPTWYASRFFGNDTEERYDRFLVKGVSVETKDILQNPYSDHDILYIKTSM